MAIELYELADVAAITGIPKSRVKNWTIGKPFSVRPSIKTSSGTGSRNLFGKNDLYSFALVQRFNEVDVPVAAIQYVLKAFELPEDSFWQEVGWLIVNRDEKGSFSVAQMLIAEEPSYDLPLEQRSTMCCYAVNIQSIVKTIGNRLEKRHNRGAKGNTRTERQQPTLPLSSERSSRRKRPRSGSKRQ